MSIKYFNVDDFGAIPDGITDSSEAIITAVEAAIDSGGPAEVRFSAGDYRVGGPYGRRYGILVKGARDLAMTGIQDKTKITVANQMISGIKVIGGENVTIKNFMIDYDPLPYTQGTITAVDFESGTYDIKLDDGYEDFNSRIYKGSNKGFGLPNRVNGEQDSQFGPWAITVNEFLDLGGRTWKVAISDKAYFKNTNLKAGARYVHKMTYWIDAAMSSSKCKNITAENITVYACPGLASMWDNNEKVTIRNFNTTIPAGSGRLLSANADGIHAFGNRGGILIDGCSFYGMADDAINIHARSAVVMKKLAPDRVVVNTGGCTDCHAGDSLMIFNMGLCIEKHKVVAAAVETGPDGNTQTITFDRDVSDIVEGKDYFDKEADNLFNLSACGQGSVIRNCNFYAFRGRGILLNTHDILIENNDFYNVEGWGVSMHNDNSWKEGPAAFDIDIRKNRFHGVGYGYASSVYINSMNAPGKDFPNKNIKNITVEGNIFSDNKSAAVGTYGVDGLIIKDNLIVNHSAARNPGAGIQLAYAKNVIISGNTIADMATQTTAGISIAGNVEKGDLGVIMENNNITVNEGTPEIKDERK